MTGNDKDITCLSQTLACYFSGGVQFRLAKTTVNHPSTDHGLLTLGQRIRQILNNDANNIVSLRGTDINECLLDTCGSNSICNNTRGSFRCKCKAGFQSTSGDGKDCSGETVEMRWFFFRKLCFP